MDREDPESFGEVELKDVILSAVPERWKDEFYLHKKTHTHMRLEKISDYFMELEAIKERKRASREKEKYLQRQRSQRGHQDYRGHRYKFHENKGRFDERRTYGGKPWYPARNSRRSRSPEPFCPRRHGNWQQAEYYRQRHGERRPTQGQYSPRAPREYPAQDQYVYRRPNERVKEQKGQPKECPLKRKAPMESHRVAVSRDVEVKSRKNKPLNLAPWVQKAAEKASLAQPGGRL